MKGTVLPGVYVFGGVKNSQAAPQALILTPPLHNHPIWARSLHPSEGRIVTPICRFLCCSCCCPLPASPLLVSLGISVPISWRNGLLATCHLPGGLCIPPRAGNTHPYVLTQGFSIWLNLWKAWGTFKPTLMPACAPPLPFWLNWSPWEWAVVFLKSSQVIPWFKRGARV